MKFFAVRAETCGDAWIDAVKKIWFEGNMVDCEPSSSQKHERTKNATVVFEIKNPLKEPRVHRADYVGYGCVIMQKGKYREELLEGTLDERVYEGKEAYTYSDRIKKWKDGLVFSDDLGRMNMIKVKVFDKNDNFIKEVELAPVNQIENVIEILKKNPYSRRAQITTWRPYYDLGKNYADPPCFQRGWFRVEDGKLDTHIYFRSRDIKAWSTNAFGFTELQKYVAENINYPVGSYFDVSDSLHIYETDWDEFQRIIDVLKKRREL